ncbi:hypothetical protein JCM6292_1052 [Bacteroides pyogenes JCM 6292]|uniref:Major fimbrial subunit protein N-terminal domain-containing protein n=1 Tax=Bacteroides pyogenes JCM 6292 TaxID=1235809 RepID=W4P628_9BACE|nr:hypothetical protein JCM6292_1052 [Bacteroides pyogenes JCM 6292]
MMKPIYKIFFLLSAALLWNTACNNDDPSGDKGEPAVISLSMNNIQTRGGDLYAGEELITQIRVYVFRGNYVDEMQVFSSGEEEFQNPFRIQTTTGPKTIYVVANEPAALTAALDGVTTLNALKGLITPAVSIPMEQPFTMTGYKPVDIAVVPGTPASVTIDLTRLVAKLTLKIKKAPRIERHPHCTEGSTPLPGDGESGAVGRRKRAGTNLLEPQRYGSGWLCSDCRRHRCVGRQQETRICV